MEEIMPKYTYILCTIVSALNMGAWTILSIQTTGPMSWRFTVLACLSGACLGALWADRDLGRRRNP